jgi:hypothetical protein
MISLSSGLLCKPDPAADTAQEHRSYTTRWGMIPYRFDARVLVDVQQIIPLPEAAEFQVQIREKARKEREARGTGVDFTRYNLDFDGEKHSSLWKRNAIFLIIQRLCAKGTPPEEITSLFKWRPNRVWYSVDGTVDATKFATLAAAKAASGGGNYDPRRWFCEDGQLIHANGKTYAFSDQWGGERWRDAMNALKDKYPLFKIDFEPTT